MTTKHTAGPWSWWPDCVRDGGMITRDGHGQHIAAPTLYFNREETAANARLMAAAPDLLASLEEVLAYCAEHGHDWMCMAQARAAVIKATGGQA